MSEKELAKLREIVLDTIDDADRKNPCLEAADRALAIAPGHPFFLWASLTQLHWFIRRSHAKFVQPPAWISFDDGEKKLAQRLAESCEVLARPHDAANGSSDRRMLLRLANLIEGQRKVVLRPSPELLAQADAHCAVYEGIVEQPFEDFEAEFGPGNFRRALRARVRAWEAVLKSRRGPEDFAFVSKAVEDDPDVLKWALDPIVVLDDFQRWASEEIASHKLTRVKEPARLGAFFSMHLRYEATAPEREMPKIVVGRLLAALLPGASDAARAAGDAVAGGLAWGLEALLRAGMDPNTLIDEDEQETLLHFAVEKGEADCVTALLRGGADPARKTKKGKTALALAEKSKKKAVLAALATGGKKDGGKVAPRPPSIDVAPVIAAAKKIPSKTIKGWASLFGERSPAAEIKELLDALSAKPPEDWSDVFQGALRDRLPWQHLVLATAAKSTTKATADSGLGSDARFVAGSLTIEGSLVLSAPLVVAGNLSVSGVIVDDDRAGWLVVAGDLRADGIVTQNDFLVGGDCIAKAFVLGSGNDHAMMVEGTLKAPLLVEDDHAIEAGKESIVERVDGDDASLSDRFVKGALDDGRLAPEKLARLARANKPVLKR